MGTNRDAASEARIRRYGKESGAPRVDKSQRITPHDVARTRALSGKVKQWADMSPEEKARVLDTIRPPGVR